MIKHTLFDSSNENADAFWWITHGINGEVFLFENCDLSLHGGVVQGKSPTDFEDFHNGFPKLEDGRITGQTNGFFFIFLAYNHINFTRSINIFEFPALD